MTVILTLVGFFMRGRISSLTESIKSKRGFTLIEVLLAMLVISLIIQMSIIIMSTAQEAQSQISEDLKLEFMHFKELLAWELANHHDVQVHERGIRMRQFETNKLMELSVINQKVAKSPGHQILIYGVNSWKVERIGDNLLVQVTFLNHDVHEGLISLRE